MKHGAAVLIKVVCSPSDVLDALCSWLLMCSSV
jgi:hypothetical protein